MTQINQPALEKALELHWDVPERVSLESINGFITTYLEEVGDVRAPYRLSTSIWEAYSSAIEDGASRSEIETAAQVAKNLPPKVASIAKWFVSGDDGICFVFSEEATPIITVEGGLLHLSIPPATTNDHFVEDVRYSGGELPQEIIEPLLAALPKPPQGESK